MKLLLLAQVLAFLVGEQTTGLTKQCFYDFAGTRYTLTVKAYELCPQSIYVEYP